jgi:hypothetical protein
MFELPLWQLSTTGRTGPGQWFAEAVATFGLGLTIFGCLARTPAAIPYAVGLYITAAYWFTASTSFANPAVTVARALSDTFAGIAPASVLAFIVAELVGMAGASRSRGGFGGTTRRAARRTSEPLNPANLIGGSEDFARAAMRVNGHSVSLLSRVYATASLLGLNARAMVCRE